MVKLGVSPWVDLDHGHLGVFIDDSRSAGAGQQKVRILVASSLVDRTPWCWVRVVLVPVGSTHFDWFQCLQTISVVAWCQAHHRLMIAPQPTEHSLLAT